MGRFTEDMGRLRDQIENDRSQRHTFIADNRQEITDAALAFMSQLRTNVADFRDNFRAAHADMAANAQVDRNAFLSRLGSAVADIRMVAADQQAAFRHAFEDSSAVARQERGEVASARRNAVVELTDNFRDDRVRMSAEVRAMTNSAVADVVGAVADIQRQTMNLVSSFTDERGSAARAWRAGPAPKPSAPPPQAAQRAAPPRAGGKGHPKAAAAKPAPEPVVMEPQREPHREPQRDPDFQSGD